MLRISLEKSRGFRLGIASAITACTLVIGTSHASGAATNAAHAPYVANVPRLPIRDLGRVAPSSRVRVELALNYRFPSELDGLIAAASDPRSPEYGAYLTPQQFEATFAPTTADYNRVVATLAAAGFTIGTSPTRSLVEASAPARVVEGFFATQLHAVQQPSVNGPRYANVVPATVPASLRPLVYGVAGLNNLIVAKAMNMRGTRRPDIALGPPLQGPDTGLGPYALASAYDLPVQYPIAKGSTKTYDGTGHAAGIAIDSDLLDSDLAGFLSYFGIKRTGPSLKRVLVDGGPSPSINFDGVETNLDVETISGLAPGAAVSLYLMPELSTADIIDTYTKVVADDKIDVLNSSFGGCELADDLSTLSDHVAVQGAAEGITFSASSGDSGSSTCFGFTENALGVSAPASAPHFTAVGGTSLIVTDAAAYRLEYAWTGSGGGVSTLFPTPSYQVGLKGVIGKTRNVPDIAFDANPGTGSAFYYDGLFQGPIGGTSLASPIFCAYVVEYNQTIGKRSGQINTALYALFKKSGYGTHFRDITVGNNEEFGAGYPYYNAGPGYDDVTGIGSIIGTPNAK